MTARLAALCAASLILSTAPALAEACRVPDRADRRTAFRAKPCLPAERLTPYDPDRVRAGRMPGFIDVGGGTEVRIGGRARLDYDTRR